MNVGESYSDKCVGIGFSGIPPEPVTCVYYVGDAPPEPPKKNIGEACGDKSECQSGLCDGGKCVGISVSCASDSDCGGGFCNGLKQCEEKKKLGISCKLDKECASGYCEKTGTAGLMDRCAEKIDKPTGTGNVGDACKSGNDCASGRCDYINEKCLPPQDICKVHEDCKKDEYCEKEQGSKDAFCKPKIKDGSVCTGSDGVFEGCVSGWCCKMRCVAKDACTASSTPSSTPQTGPSSPQAPSFAELNMLSVDSPQKLLGNILKSAMGLIGSIALVMFVYGGLLWMTAAGNSEKEKKSREIILWSGLGVLVILTAWMIVEFVFTAFE